MSQKDKPVELYPGYNWIVRHPDLLGGQPVVKGTRISVAQILECLSVGMTAEEIADGYTGFPKESIPEVLQFASNHVAA